MERTLRDEMNRALDLYFEGEMNDLNEYLSNRGIIEAFIDALDDVR
ncbi:hypothetical protein ACM26V_03335 [Salipaludibacillus sp. HK11]